MKQLLAWTGSADSTITSEAVMAMAEKFNTGQEVCMQKRGHLWVNRVVASSSAFRVERPLGRCATMGKCQFLPFGARDLAARKQTAVIAVFAE